MKQYMKFIEKLKVVERLLGDESCRERLLATCLLGAVFEYDAPLVQQSLPELYEPRWGVVQLFCQKVVKPLAVLQRAWPQKASEGDGKRDEQGKPGDQNISPAETTHILSSNLFRSYLGIIIKLKQLPTTTSKWFDACGCHEEILKGCETEWAKDARLSKGKVSAQGIAHA